MTHKGGIEIVILILNKADQSMIVSFRSLREINKNPVLVLASRILIHDFQILNFITNYKINLNFIF